MKHHLNTQVIHPTFIKDLNTGLYELPKFITLAVVKKLDKVYAADDADSSIIVGVDLAPFFDFHQHDQRDILRYIAWSLSHLASNVTDIVIVTWPETNAISVNECRNRFDTDLRFMVESYPDTLLPDIPRTNSSGHLSKVATNLDLMLHRVGQSFFPPTT